MTIVYCRSCDTLFMEDEMIIHGHCPVCESADLEVVDCKLASTLSKEHIRALWMYYRDYGYYSEDGESIDEMFLDFPRGTKLPVIWKWFDEVYSDGVYELMNN